MKLNLEEIQQIRRDSVSPYEQGWQEGYLAAKREYGALDLIEDRYDEDSEP